MHYEKLTKLEVAEVQLFHAVELYLAGSHLVSVITLAGAAEEILGELVKRKSNVNALDEKIEKLLKMHDLIFKESANRKEFVKLRNKARNGFKHIGNSETMELNLEDEAVKLLNRAIRNYKKLTPGRYPLFRDFEKERSRRYRIQAGKA